MGCCKSFHRPAIPLLLLQRRALRPLPAPGHRFHGVGRPGPDPAPAAHLHGSRAAGYSPGAGNALPRGIRPRCLRRGHPPTPTPAAPRYFILWARKILDIFISNRHSSADFSISPLPSLLILAGTVPYSIRFSKVLGSRARGNLPPDSPSFADGVVKTVIPNIIYEYCFANLTGVQTSAKACGNRARVPPASGQGAGGGD